MPVRMINFLQEPPPPKKFSKIIEGLPEWQDFCMALGAGLKPQEYITVNFPPGNPVHDVCKFPNAAFISAAKKKIKAMHLPYDVYERNNIIYVVGRGVIS
jgi:hypothetical protein